MSDIKLSILYKLTSIVIGFILMVLGYKLILKRYEKDNQNLSLTYGGIKLLLENFSTGIIFSLFGALIITISLFKGIEIQSHLTSNDNKIGNSLMVDTAGLPDSKLPNAANRTSNEIYHINLDSVYYLAQTNFFDKKYATSLKYLYFLKGILLFEKGSIAFNEMVNKDIKRSEAELSEILNEKQAADSSNQIKSIKITNDNKDSVR